MTTKVLVLVNGPAYEVTVEKKDSAGQVVETQKRRGGSDGMGVVETYLGTDQTITVTEAYVGQPAE